MQTSSPMWTDFTIQLLASGAVSVLLSGAVLWLTKSWISERLQQAIKNEYDQKLETHKAQLKAQSVIEITRLQSELRIAATEHEVKFSRLHEKRAEVIAELYGHLVQAYWDASSFVSLMEWNGEPGKEQKYVTAMNAIAEFYRFFDKNRIYLPEQICSDIGEFVQNMRKKVIGFGAYVRCDDTTSPPHVLDKKYEAWTNAWEYFEKHIPSARSALEHELRRILGAV